MSGLNQSMDAGMHGYQHGMAQFGGQNEMNQVLNNKFAKNPHTQVIISGYEKQFVTNQPNKGNTHMRGNSQIVPGNANIKGHVKQNSNQFQDVQNSNFQTQYEMSAAQMSQLNHMSQSQNRLQEERMITAMGHQQQVAGGDRIIHQKAKRKNNLSQQLQQQSANQNQRNSMLLAENKAEVLHGGTYESLKSQTGLIGKIQTTYPINDQKYIPSKRSENGEGNKIRQKHAKNSSVSNQRNDFLGQQQNNQYDSGRIQIKRFGDARDAPNHNQITMQDEVGTNSNTKMPHHAQLRLSQANISKERFHTHSQTKGTKKSKISTTQNQIILPAGSLLQGVPQLKQQLNSKHVSVTNSQHSQKKSQMSHSLQPQSNNNHNQSHQRIQSLHDSGSVGANISRGFNSASNAALQQQAQIMQIYQHQGVNNIMGTSNSQNIKQVTQSYNNSASGNQANSRKIIPQINQVISHHKRTNQHQISRDRESKQLVVESFPQNNYQTYNQSMATNSQLKGMLSQKQNSTDSSRISRIHNKETNPKRHLVSGNETQNLPSEINSSYNTQMNAHTGSMTIPQKKLKQMQTVQKLNQTHGHNQSLQNFGKSSNYTKSGGLSFFEHPQNGISTQSMAQVIHHSENSFDNRNAQANGFTPQIALSMKQTINTNPFDSSQPQSSHMGQNEALILKSNANIPNQIHMRQSSMQLGDASNHSKKMSIQHRKNKSMLNNQIKINQNQQNQRDGTNNQKMRQSHEHTGKNNKLTQIYENYADHMQSNFYMQQPMVNKSVNNNTGTINNQSQQIIGGQAHLKQNLTQSSHRKNKTSVIGNQKMSGINSSSAFYPVSNLPHSLIAAESQPPATIKKVIGGTIQHSHKSLRSTSSTRKRVGSIDQNSNKHKFYQNNSSSKFVSNKEHINVDFVPELSQYTANIPSKHQKSSSNGNFQKQMTQKPQIKPQGNIVIQQQQTQGSKQGPVSQHEQNLIQAQVNRRQNSILKGEHQNKQMIYIDQDQHYAKNTQQVAQRFGNTASNNRDKNLRSAKQTNNQQESSKKRHDQENQTPDGESVYSVSSIRAQAIGFADGGTGAVKIKQNTRQSQLNKDSFTHQPISSNTDKRDKLYELSNQNNKTYENIQSKHQRSDSLTINSSKGAQGQKHTKNKSISHKEIEVNQEIIKVQSKPEIKQIQQRLKSGKEKSINHRNTIDGLSEMDFMGCESINITKEALAIGKVPPEKIADMIKASKHTLQENDTNLSPRTREMVNISKLISHSFKTNGVAPRTTPDFYRAGKMLGRGAFGKVSLGMHKLSRKLVALKSINKEYMSDQKQKSKVMHEVGILLRLRHQSVVKLYETFETKRHMLLSMELCAGGDLLNYVRKRKKLDEVSAKLIFKQLIQGLGYIHRKRILHRDIKLDNILLDGNGNVKIADFGVSKLVKPGDTMHEQSGTPAYIAPEILREQGYKGFKADIWSAGVVLYAMLCGTVPFKASNMKELHKMIMKGKYYFKEEVTDVAKSLLKGMLDINPKTRITIQEILKHPWMTSIPDDAPEIFNQEEKEIVKREFIYNNPKIVNRSEQINNEVEPWDCFTELNLDSINQTLRNESEKSVILAPFNSSLSDFNEEEYLGMEANLIIHRLFHDAAKLEEKKDMVRFAARCRDQDRQYEINNNGELDNGVYHKFVYSSRDGNPEPSSSLDKGGGSFNDLRPQSSRNANKPSGEFKNEIAKRIREGKMIESETDDYGIEDSVESIPTAEMIKARALDENRITTLKNFGYPEDYIRFCLAENESCYCLATYFLLGEDQRY